MAPHERGHQGVWSTLAKPRSLWGGRRVRLLLVVILIVAAVSQAFAQNPYVRAAGAVPQLERIQCPQDLMLAPGTVMTYRGAMSEIVRLCYLAPLHPDEFRAAWGEALASIGAKAPLRWNTIGEDPRVYRMHSYTSTHESFIGLIELFENPTGEAHSLIALSTGEMELDTATGRPFIIVGSTRFAVVKALLSEGWEVSAEQSGSDSILGFYSDVDLVVRFDDEDVAISASFYGGGFYR